MALKGEILITSILWEQRGHIPVTYLTRDGCSVTKFKVQGKKLKSNKDRCILNTNNILAGVGSCSIAYGK